MLVGRDEEIMFARGYGMADAAAGEPITPASRFVIGSVTKQFTCMAVLLLESRGMLRVDDEVGKYLPGMPAWRDQVTLRHLMTHTGGVPEYLTEEFWRAAAAGGYPDQASVLRLIADLGDLEYAPGTNWRYCNSGYIMLGAIVEIVAGQSFASFIKDNIFDRLGMASSLVGESDERVPRLAVGYEYKSRDEFAPAPWCFPVIGWADGNIISDTADLFRWGQTLYTDELLPYGQLAKAFVPCKPLDPAFSRYGFGHQISERRGVRVIQHGGATLGFVSSFARFTDERVTIVVLSNAAGIKLAEIAGGIAETVLADSLAPMQAVELPAGLADRLTGVYHGSPRGRSITVTISGPAQAGASAPLVAVVEGGGHREQYDLVYLGGDLFCADLVTDTYIRFVWDNGRLGGLRLILGGGVQNFSRLPADG